MKKIIILIFQNMSEIIRRLIGPRGVCIYPISCRSYARKLLEEKPWYKAFPLIVWQVVSCNPVTVLWWKWKKK